MREYVTIRQKAFYEFLQHYNKDKPKEQQIWLDLKDLVIFEYIAQFCLSDNVKIKNNRIVIDDKEFTYISYKKILEDNPFLNIKAKNISQVIGSHINKLVKLGLLDKIFLKENGNKVYFRVSLENDNLITQNIQGVSFQNDKGVSLKNDKGYHSKMSNSMLNIDNKNIDSKNRRNSIYIGSLSDFEKTLLRVISNLQDLFTRYRLPKFPVKDYYNTYKGILKKGYTEKQLLRAIYTRVYKATNDGVDTLKFLETLANPKYTIKSIDQLIVESEAIIEQLELIYDEEEMKAVNYILYTEFLKQCYFYDYAYYIANKKINYLGFFKDFNGQLHHLVEIEYHLLLMKKYLQSKGYELTTEGITTSNKGIRHILISNSLDTLPYSLFIKKLLYGLLISEEDKNIDLETYSSIKGIVNLHNNYLNKLKITDSLDEIISQLEEKIQVEV
ncbi:conserved hypothetical protein [Lebetimonas natsushimae]|uniref:Uncharacterized protein n=1 Tax=Lebetimonas natsushimae TaxID=1936991 RepID=A0A292YCJ3_9BACT|nr:hypothetical protein [Lebetimonas natsushimae]GAX87004.1 conserved hypothetical protein [Lebetimonas natsushimae]